MARAKPRKSVHPSRRSPIAISLGDPTGIGPEVTAKTLKFFSKNKPSLRFQVFGDWGPYVPQKSLRGLKNFVHLPPPKAPKGAQAAGFASGWAIETAARSCLAHQSRALVTAPISKKNLNLGGYLYPGHTEFLQQLSSADSVTMMLANSELRVSLVTIHHALSSVPSLITPEALSRTLSHTISALRERWRISKPAIAICGLNPHAGDGGLLGTEETDWINHWVKTQQELYKKAGTADISGPHAADSLFARHAEKKGGVYDAIIAMYQDQGLIPVKLLGLGTTVNVTLNLPFVRTSVDHGTAFDIAGKGIADPSSMIAAVQEALRLT